MLGPRMTISPRSPAGSGRFASSLMPTSRPGNGGPWVASRASSPSAGSTITTEPPNSVMPYALTSTLCGIRRCMARSASGGATVNTVLTLAKLAGE